MELGIPGSGNGFGLGSLDVVGTSKQKWSTRSEGLKQEGSGFFGGDAWRASKMARTEADFSPAANADVSSDAHMLRFSPGFKLGSSALPDFHHMEAAQYKNSGYYSSGGLDASTGMYLLSGVRGPFTPSQWLELEQQALIYRYITANEPIPVHLLIPIRKAFDSAGFYGLNATTLKSTAWGWGPFHLGYSNSSTDPEPGRCRRTDGKKWRCSRDAVASQKYCEKHMNRGRHRSRKHVEGQGTASGATKSSTIKPMPPAVLPGGGSSNNFNINPNMNTSLNRMIVNRENSGQTLQDATQLSFLSHGINLNCSGSSFSISKHQICSQESALNGFGALSSSEHLLDPASQKGYGSYTHILNDPEEPETRDSLFTFLDNWPNNNHCSANLMSSTSSPANEKAAVSPLRLSQEHEIGLGFGSQFQSPGEAANWKPISWEASMGGPLAEALQGNSISNHADESRERCQLSSSSPTGVLQRSALVSLSNSSAGSSPRAGKTN